MADAVKDLFSTVADKRDKQGKTMFNTALKTLNNAKLHFDNMRDVRNEGERCHNYVNGRQWDDKIIYEGRLIPEREALIKQGYNPRTSNLLNRVVKNVMGVVLKNGNEPTAYSMDGNEQGFADVLNVLCQANNSLNKTDILYPSQFKQFMEWGMLIGKSTFGWNTTGDNRSIFDCWSQNIDPRVFFTDTGQTDIRGWDCSIIGMLHTASLDDILSSFATDKNPKVAAEKHKQICDIYHKCSTPEGRREICGQFSEQFGRPRIKNVDFLFPKDGDMCRLIEVWTKETRAAYYVHDWLDASWKVIPAEEYDEYVEAENNRRIQLAQQAGVPNVDIALAKAIVNGEEWAEKESMPATCKLRVADFTEDRYWYYRYITPSGEVLDEGESPYLHGGHPFSVMLYPFVNGEIRSFMADLLDEQRDVNRLLTMYDSIMRHSAKGFLAYNKNTLPEEDADGYELTRRWSDPGGSYGFDLKPGEQLQQQVIQISGNNTNIGIMELLQSKMTRIEDISGVNGALQGKPGYSTTSGTLYMQQAQNATGSLLDVIGAFYSFLLDCSYKQIKNILQTYSPEKIDKIAGVGSYAKMLAAVGTSDFTKIELEIRMLESPSSPAYRQVANDFLMAWLQQGFIDFPTMLKVGHFPFSDKLLTAWQDANIQAVAEGGQPLPDRMPQQSVEASVIGANAPNTGNNLYNQMAERKPV